MIVSKIIRYEKIIKDLKNENRMLKITVSTNNVILKKQMNILKQGNDFIQKKNDNCEQIQKIIYHNKDVLNSADDMKKKQELFDSIFYEK